LFIDIQKVLFNGAGVPTEWYVSPSTVRLLGCEEFFLWRDPLESLLQAYLPLFPLPPPLTVSLSLPQPPAPPFPPSIPPLSLSLCAHIYPPSRTYKTLWRGGQVWPLLLSRAAGDSSVPDSVLLQMIKDASDHVERLDWDLSHICGRMELLDALRSLVLYFSVLLTYEFTCTNGHARNVALEAAPFPTFSSSKKNSSLFLTRSILRAAYSPLTCWCTKLHVLCHLCTAGWAMSA
jgi:hypothetical protein